MTRDVQAAGKAGTCSLVGCINPTQVRMRTKRGQVSGAVEYICPTCIRKLGILASTIRRTRNPGTFEMIPIPQKREPLDG